MFRRKGLASETSEQTITRTPRLALAGFLNGCWWGENPGHGPIDMSLCARLAEYVPDLGTIRTGVSEADALARIERIRRRFLASGWAVEVRKDESVHDALDRHFDAARKRAQARGEAREAAAAA